MIFNEHLGKLIRYQRHIWLLDRIVNGQAELWFNGTMFTVPIDDLDLNDVIEITVDEFKKGR